MVNKIEEYSRILNVDLKRKKHYFKHIDDNSFLLMFSCCNISLKADCSERVIIYSKNNNIEFFTDNHSCMQIIDKIEKGNSVEKKIFDFFSQLVIGDMDKLENIEQSATQLEDLVLLCKHNGKAVASKIVAIRRRMLIIKRYYEQLLMILNDLTLSNCNNDAKQQFDNLINKIKLLLDDVNNIREVVEQVRETYQSQIDIEQNGLMKIFTIITTIFMPLTVIVGWYGMNFKNMPELSWSNGYLYVIVLSIAVSVVTIFIFVINKWFK